MEQDEANPGVALTIPSGQEDTLWPSYSIPKNRFLECPDSSPIEGKSIDYNPDTHSKTGTRLHKKLIRPSPHGKPSGPSRKLPEIFSNPKLLARRTCLSEKRSPTSPAKTKPAPPPPTLNRYPQTNPGTHSRPLQNSNVTPPTFVFSTTPPSATLKVQNSPTVEPPTATSQAHKSPYVDPPPLSKILTSPGAPSNRGTDTQNPTKPDFSLMRPWSTLFQKETSPIPPTLNFINPHVSPEGIEKAKFGADEVSTGGEKWRNCLLGFFLGKRPYFRNLKDNLTRKWKLKGEMHLMALHKGFYLFKFSCPEDCISVLETENHSYAGKPLIIKRWTPKGLLDQGKITRVPIWIKFPGLPLEFWNQNGISKIASLIGTPLYMDSLTAECTRLNFARLCVEIQIGAKLPDSVIIETPEGTQSQEVLYEWKPSACPQCLTFSHSAKACPKSVREEKPKDKQEWRAVEMLPSPDETTQTSTLNPTETSIPNLVPNSKKPNPASSPKKTTTLESNKDKPIIISNKFDILLCEVQEEGTDEGTEKDLSNPPPRPEIEKSNPINGKGKEVPISSSGPAPTLCKTPIKMLPQSPLKSFPTPMIKLASWNIRGLCSSTKRGFARDLTASENLEIICLLEVKAKKDDLLPFIQEICLDWNAVTNYSHVIKGRIWVAWNLHYINFTPLGDSDHHIHGTVLHLQSQTSCFLTAVYASNFGILRRTLWDNLNRSKPPNSPWLIIGDFNIIRYISEKLGGADPNREDMKEFNDCIDHCSLLDLKTIGPLLTWSNKSKNDNLKLRKLDRALVNDEWLSLFPQSFAANKNPGISNHSPIIIHLHPESSRDHPPFRFFFVWLEDLSLYEVVERMWQINLKGTPMFRLVRKLKLVKQAIKNWNYKIYGRIDITLPIIKDQLNEIQSKIAVDPTNYSLRETERLIRENLLIVARKEEAIVRQKARIDWLNLGDSNTNFFHSAINSRRNMNHIYGMTKSNGEISTSKSEIEESFVNYFKNTLNSTDSHFWQVRDPLKVISPLQASSLTDPISKEEIERVIHQADGNKSPGPDGFNADFFKAFWHLIGEEVTTAIQNFFHCGEMLSELNTTFITLIPKLAYATSPDKFRPISLCNFLYKIITKILASRLSGVISDIISPNQSAFIKGRLIQDNILLTHDVMHNFHSKDSKQAICLKLDLQKAFDNVNLQSLLTFMSKQGFNDTWCNWAAVGGDEMGCGGGVHRENQNRGRRKSLWNDWVQLKYLKKQSIWQMKMPSHPSWGFKGILQTRDTMKNHICYSVGTGENINFWDHPWHPEGTISNQSSSASLLTNISKKTNLSSILLNGIWDQMLSFLLQSSILVTLIKLFGNLAQMVFSPQNQPGTKSESKRRKSPGAQPFGFQETYPSMLSQHGKPSATDSQQETVCVPWVLQLIKLAFYVTLGLNQ
ncbi:uncharacterized protein LOC143865668 [Tasmannia lanceolata]|uniref:uncharacterized protein LOC143865668 n=1 Tax=Tasmannia lanceolata TaxID=3420 RepID=UPI004063F752